MAQGANGMHHTMFLHICYHLALLDFSRPLIRWNSGPRLRLRTFESAEACPEAVYAASVNQLKRIVLFHRQTYPQSSFCLLWRSALLYLANAMLREASDAGNSAEWHFYFRLGLASYQSLYSGFRHAKGITQILLFMALEEGVMGLREAQSIRRDLDRWGRHHDVSDRVPQSLVVDLDYAVTDPSAAQAERMVQKFQELQLDDAEGDHEASSP